MGYCIRTGEEIPLNFDKPLSYDAYKKWSEYSNPDYPEKYCHFTGNIVTGKLPTLEAIDFFTAYQIAEGFRVYGGLGWIFHSDSSFPMKPFYVEYGGEVRAFGTRSYYYMLYGTPFFAVFMKNWQEMDWRLDATIALGYEWSKLQGVGRKVQKFMWMVVIGKKLNYVQQN